MLATLEELKQRVGVETADVSQDNDLLLALSASSAKILDLCGYVETTGQVVDTFTDVKQGFERRLSKRPVDPTSFVVEGRGQGMAFATIVGDLLVPEEGRFIILAHGSWWPPVYRQTPSFRRWREPAWPVIRVTYTATGIGDETTAPDELREATVALTAFWLGAAKAGAATQQQVGQVAQTISSEPLPATIAAILGRKHYRAVGARVAG